VVRTPGDGWPQALLYMRGEYTEAELIDRINEGDSEDNTQPNTSTDERLCEALFYVGEDYARPASTWHASISPRW
jgi:hypothetical protein